MTMMTSLKYPDMKSLMQSVFGFDSFRPLQSRIVSAILEGRDVFAVLPTGGGKSLCYQLPALMTGGISVIISPLISLMRDQVEAAGKRGIASACINSSLTGSERRDIYRSLKRGGISLLYAAPERMVLESFLDNLESLPVSLFAIDEAHCISQWGNDFRPDYLGLSRIPERFPKVPLAAFTATATMRVQRDIIGRIGFRDPVIVRAPFDRPNLFYAVLPGKDAVGQILAFLKNKQDGQGIIYCHTRKKASETAELLRHEGIRALCYHGGLTADERVKCQDAFTSGEASVIAATVAFGMGIDKPDIRFVFHLGLPGSLERYAQETGRAGRDGKPSLCVLFYSRADIMRHSYFMGKMESDMMRRVAAEELDSMVAFAESVSCRRRELLSYFGEETSGGSCGWCDICMRGVARQKKGADALVALFTSVCMGRPPEAEHSEGSKAGLSLPGGAEKEPFHPLLSCKTAFDRMISMLRRIR